jgi:hypothetical protein
MSSSVGGDFCCAALALAVATPLMLRGSWLLGLGMLELTIWRCVQRRSDATFSVRLLL